MLDPGRLSGLNFDARSNLIESAMTATGTAATKALKSGVTRELRPDQGVDPGAAGSIAARSFANVRQYCSAPNIEQLLARVVRVPCGPMADGGCFVFQARWRLCFVFRLAAGPCFGFQLLLGGRVSALAGVGFRVSDLIGVCRNVVLVSRGSSLRCSQCRHKLP